MTTAEQVQSGTLTNSDLETVEHIVSRVADDIAISIARSFERIEERMDGTESRLSSRFQELEDLLAKIQAEGAEWKASLASVQKTTPAR